MDLRKERTLKNLSESLIELLHEKPLEQISVSEICEKAMVRRATFYRHFSDKIQLLQYVVRQRRLAIQNTAIDSPKDASLEEYCHIMTKELVKLIFRHQVIIQRQKISPTFAQEVNEIADEIGREFAKKIASFQGQSIPNERISLIARFYSSGLLGAIRWWIDESQTKDEKELLKTLEALASKLFTEDGF